MGDECSCGVLIPFVNLSDHPVHVALVLSRSQVAPTAHELLQGAEFWFWFGFIWRWSAVILGLSTAEARYEVVW